MCKSCKTCFVSYWMFYFTCDRSLIDAIWYDTCLSTETPARWVVLMRPWQSGLVPRTSAAGARCSQQKSLASLWLIFFTGSARRDVTPPFRTRSFRAGPGLKRIGSVIMQSSRVPWRDKEMRDIPISERNIAVLKVTGLYKVSLPKKNSIETTIDVINVRKKQWNVTTRFYGKYKVRKRE